MNRDLILVAIVATFAVTNGIPWKDSSPAPEHGWGWGGGAPMGGGWGGGGHGGGWGERPAAYDINPHFGFRQYSEMRYEPLTTPYLYSTQLTGPPAQTQPLAPLFRGEGPPYSPHLPQPVRSVGLLAPPQGGGYPTNNNLYDDGYVT